MCRPHVRRSLKATLFGSPFLLLLVGCHPAPRAGAPAAQPSIARSIDALLARPELAHSNWGVLAKSLKTGETLYARDAGKLFLPASNMKILTTAVAAARLGWDFTYETKLQAAGPLSNGVLDGDLIVSGDGDPSLTSVGAGSTFDAWADRLEASGISRINGRVIADTYFVDEPLGFGWSWTDLADDYSAGVSELQVDESTVRVTITPAREPGGTAGVAIDPPFASVDAIVFTGPAGSSPEIVARRLPEAAGLMLRGSVPLGSKPETIALAVPRPPAYFVNRLRTVLIAHGIDVRGPAVTSRDVQDDEPPAGRLQTMLTHRSQPLSALATRLMKVSQNLYADTFLKTVGGTALFRPSWDGGRDAMRETLTAWGVPAEEAFVADGSGLSRYNFVSPNAIVAVLAHVYDDPALRDPFMATMPVAGRDGTLDNRMKGTAAEGNVRAKTGSMTRVRCVSGYVTTAAGEPLAFSILANNFDVAPAVITKTADAIMIKLAELR